MGYACPVCEDPQADAGHLANHLAFTAMLRGGEHEAWLDDHVPDWSEMDETELGEAVVDLAADEEFPQVFEDTTEQGTAGGQAEHDHAHDGHAHDEHGRARDEPGHDYDSGDPVDAVGMGDVSNLEELEEGELEDVMAEARELTRQRREESETE